MSGCPDVLTALPVLSSVTVWASEQAGLSQQGPPTLCSGQSTARGEIFVPSWKRLPGQHS